MECFKSHSQRVPQLLGSPSRSNICVEPTTDTRAASLQCPLSENNPTAGYTQGTLSPNATLSPGAVDCTVHGFAFPSPSHTAALLPGQLPAGAPPRP